MTNQEASEGLVEERASLSEIERRTLLRFALNTEAGEYLVDRKVGRWITALFAENCRYKEALADIADNDKTTGNGWADRNLLRHIARQALSIPDSE